MKISNWTLAANSGKKRPVAARWDARDDLYITTEHQISCLKNDTVYYSKRPTQASAFITKSATPIAALSTTKRVFAFSNGNTKLECWSSSDASSETLITLPSPAVDIEFCAPYVYGSCEDGKAFVTIGGTVEIIPTVVEGGTMRKTVMLPHSTVLIGTKRKAKIESAKLYQVFQAKGGIVLVIHELLVEDTTIQVTRSDTKVLPEEYCNIEIVGVHHDHVGFCYDREKQRYFGSLSLVNARIASFVLPAGARRVALMGPLLVVLLGNSLMFLDSMRGGIIDEKSLPHTMDSCDEDAMQLIVKERKLALLFGNDAVQVATATLSSSTVGNLASLLTNSLQTTTKTLFVRQFVHSPDASLEESVSMLIDAYDLIVSNKACKENFLLRSFENALKCLVPPHNDGDNPQEQSPKKRSKVSSNGVHHNGMNGNLAPILTDFPTAVVDCMTEIVVRLLCVDKLALSDSAILLRRLTRTKKVSARRHFSSLPRILLALRRSVDYNSTNFLTDMFQYCPDISESQLVSCLRFGMCYFTADDFLEGATNGEKQPSTNGKKDQHAVFKVIRKSLCHLLGQILTYSSCNDSLLRAAFVDVLSTAEMKITLTLLVERLESNSDANTKMEALQWISNLCDCLNKRNDHSIDIHAIRRRITSYVKNIQGTIVLKGVIDSIMESIKGSRNGESVWTGKLPPYQIERLTF
ncbi:hypothetical protein FisN_1Lh709 [Fistulifera solaris]|uniref:Uncharacterized protein n=1 Tax=Fistulifera solaris TaxID=1519565 RepID=A0A1Z5KJI5_FISSO|nr:hypothetical protein FisN_1Lh709 [Fistulifera solaris]|eukprot:GAX26464.1 hypothetical protein FisN_1Lh709 [Fistulifera solaris]